MASGFWMVLFFFTSSIYAGALNEDVTEPLRNYSTPTKLVSASQYPIFDDDINFENLSIAIDRQLNRYEKKNMLGTISLGGKLYPQMKIVKTLKEFKKLANVTSHCLKRQKKEICFKKFNEEIKNRFLVFAPDIRPGDARYGEKRETFFTGYYTPSLRGSKVQTEEFPWAVYGKPSDRNLASSTREDIDFRGVLRGKDLELFYSDDLFDIYNLHVEGGGRVIFENGEGSVYLNYDGTNRKKWQFISIYMRKKGMIESGSHTAQREYLERHPEKQREIYSTCPSYVYFKPTKNQPHGSDMVSLTNRRSIATDSKHYKLKGMLAFVVGERPEELEEYTTETEAVENLKLKPFSRFFLDQDTGGAIKGKGRVDLYFGEGPYAAYAAANQTSTGNLYFLLIK